MPILDSDKLHSQYEAGDHVQIIWKGHVIYIVNVWQLQTVAPLRDGRLLTDRIARELRDQGNLVPPD